MGRTEGFKGQLLDVKSLFVVKWLSKLDVKQF